MLQRATRARPLRGLLFGAAVIVTTACGPAAAAGANPTSLTPTSGAAASAGLGTPVANALIVNMTDANRFQPATLSVPKGAKVTWTNTGQTEHTVTADPAKAINSGNVALPAGAQPWDSGAIGGGQSFSRTFDVPGTYRYTCIPHEALGMLATIVVTN
jgi:plastocyanin